MTLPPWYALAFRELEKDVATVRRRIARGRARPDDRDELEATERALAELRADLEARLRAAKLAKLADSGGSPLGR